jgi:hypothetical protein
MQEMAFLGLKFQKISGPPKMPQPRTQALFSMLLAGGETLVNAGHMAPRFWECGYRLLGRGGFVRYLRKCKSCHTFHQYL